MKRITIEIPDEVFEAFDKSVKQAGRKFAETTADLLAKNSHFLDVNQTRQDNSLSLDKWKKERGFGLNGKGLSRSLRRRNTPK